MSVQTPCGRCGTPIDAGGRFCTKCGLDQTTLGGQPGEPAGDETVMAPPVGDETVMAPPAPGQTPVGADETVVAADATVADVGGSADDATVVGGPATGGPQVTMRQRLREATEGEYEIMKELGRGGMATVFLAHDVSLDRRVAIKVMAPHLMAGEGMAERFKLEARTAAQLSHPHIIPIYAVKETGSALFFVMKYVEGRPLDEVVAKTGPMPIPMVKDILGKVGSALGYAHRRGVVHRDIKPGNIMIDEEGTPIVTDFGIAKVAENTGLTQTGTTIGTPSYMSPEQCEAKEVTGASDQYSLGVVAFQMLTGKLPFEADSAVGVMYKHAHEAPPPLEDFRPDCPPDLRETVHRTLAKDPAERWPTLEAVVQRLGADTTGTLDAVRQQLVEAAKAGDLERVRELSTPGVSMPGVGGGTAAATGSGGAKRRRSPLAAVAAAVVVAGAGTLAVLQPWAADDATRPEDAGQPTATTTTDGSSPTGGPAGAEGGESTEGLTGEDGAGSGAPPPDDAGTPGNRTGGDEPTTASDPDRSGETDGPDEPTLAPPETAAGARSVAALRIGGAPAELEPGETATLSVAALDGSRREIPANTVDGGFLWRSGDESVARVAASGVLTAVEAGTTEISVTAGGRTETVTVTVVEAEPERITVANRELRMTVGETRDAGARAQGRRNQPLLGRLLDWSSTDETVATVSDVGEITAVAPGQATVTVSIGRLTQAIEVSVVAAPLTAREAIPALIEAYARALESRDPERVRAAYPGMTNEQANRLRQSLPAMESLRIETEIVSIDAQGDQAVADVSATWNFVVDGRAQQAEQPFRAVFRRTPDGWRMMETRSGG